MRYPLIDTLRTLAILLMILFHLFWDLTSFGILSINFKENLFWQHLPRLIVFLFFLCVGVSLRLVHYPTIQWKKLFQKLLLLTLLSAMVSLATYYVFPQNWIYFGTLHSIVVCTLFTLPFLPHPKISFIVAIALFIPSLLWDKSIPWITLSHASLDYISPFPWFGAMLFGITLHHFDLHKLKDPHIEKKWIHFLSNHSLFIYMVHQPILFGATYLLSKLIA